MKKVIALTVLGVTLIGGSKSIDAGAWSDWNKGLYNGNNGYYMAYSYYYETTGTHYSWAKLNNKSSGNIYAPAGETSCANSPSRKSTSWNAGHSDQ